MLTFEKGFEIGFGDEIDKAFRDGTWAQRTQSRPVKIAKSP